MRVTALSDHRLDDGTTDRVITLDALVGRTMTEVRNDDALDGALTDAEP